MIKNGIDIVKIEKVKKMLDKSNTFVETLLTKEERNYYESKRTTVERQGVIPKQIQMAIPRSCNSILSHLIFLEFI